LVPHVETVVGQLVAADLLPAVWFIFSRKGCDQAAEYLCQCGASLVSGAERRKIAEALAAFETDNPDAVRPEAVEPLLLGIASHHAGLLPGWKGLVESLFQRGLLKVVFATETLAAGVNMPARSSVLSCLSKRDDSGPRMLTSNEFMQMAGRAGRRGYDSVGHVVALQSPFEGPEEAFALVTSPPENLRSRFSVSYGMALNLVNAGSDLRTVRATVERSFGNYLGGRATRRASCAGCESNATRSPNRSPRAHRRWSRRSGSGSKSSTAV
jgi:superfamily II RNA helicase